MSLNWQIGDRIRLRTCQCRPRARGQCARDFAGIDGVTVFLKVEKAIQGTVETAGDGVFPAIEEVEESGIAVEVGTSLNQKSGEVGTEGGGFDGPGALLTPFETTMRWTRSISPGVDGFVLFQNDLFEGFLGLAGQNGPRGGERNSIKVPCTHGFESS